MYILDFMGLAVLDPEFSRPMLPWVVREVIYRDEARIIQLVIQDDQIEFHELNEAANDEPKKVENSFHSDGYKIKDVYHPAHDPNSFAFVTREASSTPCSCYVFRNTSVELVETVVKQLKHEVGSGKRKRLGETTGESELVSYEVAMLGKSNVVSEKPNQDLIDSVIESLKLQNTSGEAKSRPNSTLLEHYETEITSRNRVSTSSDLFVERRRDIKEETKTVDARRSNFLRQRSHSYDASHYKPENKTKIFQIGIDRLTIIDTDGPGVLDVKFSRVSRCVQGIKHPACFGFVAREPKRQRNANQAAAASGAVSGPDFTFHIFQCFDEQTCEDIMCAIKQAFSASLRPVTPLHAFHRLCVKLNHTTEIQQRLNLVSNVVETISEGEKFYINRKLKTLTPGDATERLVFTVAVLREIFEVKNREQQLYSGLKKPSYVTAPNNARRVEDIASKLGSKFSVLSRNVTQNVQKMSDRIGDMNRDIKGKVATKVTSIAVNRPESRTTTISNITTEGNHTPVAESPTRCDLDDFNSLESNETDLARESPVKSIRQHIYESVNSNPSISYLTQSPSYRDREVKTSISTPDSVKTAWHQVEREHLLLKRVLKMTKLDSLNTEMLENSLVELWTDLIEYGTGTAVTNKYNEKLGELLPPSVIHAATYLGIPETLRGPIWSLLIKQRETRHELNYEGDYEVLINQLAPPGQAHSILIDLCRTFPKHRQFRESLAQSAGQKSLYNVLKAYCLLDTEVGYCQGLSFVVGLILIYLPNEEDAFRLLRHMMLGCNMRRYYMPDMAALQEAMYQLSRLLAEMENDLYHFLEDQGVTPVLYLTPWFLTMFASNFPLNFAVRVLDMVVAEGPSAIFKISMALLRDHKVELMKLDGFEQVADYIKNQMNTIDVDKMKDVLHVAGEIDLGTRLEMFATEYIVLSEHDLIKEPGQMHWSPSKNIVKDLRVENRKLREQINIQETQITALQESLIEIEDEALRQQEHNKLIDGLVRERNDLKELVEKLSDQLGNLSAEQNLQNSKLSSRVASPT